MQRKYIKPSIKEIVVKARTILASSPWNENEQAGIDPNPGSQDNFGAKEDFIDFGW